MSLKKKKHTPKKEELRKWEIFVHFLNPLFLKRKQQMVTKIALYKYLEKSINPLEKSGGFLYRSFL